MTEVIQSCVESSGSALRTREAGVAEMVERVARALWNELRGRAGIKHFVLHIEGKPSEGEYEDSAWWLREIARSAIEAMREPTEAMVEASGAGDDPDFHINDLRNAWGAMIDAALSSSGARE